MRVQFIDCFQAGYCDSENGCIRVSGFSVTPTRVANSVRAMMIGSRHDERREAMPIVHATAFYSRRRAAALAKMRATSCKMD